MVLFALDAADRRLLDDRRGAGSMTGIMAIMLFLTVSAAALGLGTLAGAVLLQRQVAGRLTVQIVEADQRALARDVDTALKRLRAVPEVARATPVDRAELAALLRPWLGEESDDPDLPVPAMIDVDLRADSDAAVAAVARSITEAVPTARIDRHARWLSPVNRLLRLVVVLTAAMVLLIAAATAAVVVLATRAGLEAHRATIEVLHMLGSTDVQVARLFQHRIAVSALIGGGLGTVAAIAVAMLTGGQLAALGSDLFAGIALSRWDWTLLAVMPLLFTGLAAVAARVAVLRALRRYP